MSLVAQPSQANFFSMLNSQEDINNVIAFRVTNLVKKYFLVTSVSYLHLLLIQYFNLTG